MGHWTRNATKQILCYLAILWMIIEKDTNFWKSLFLVITHNILRNSFRKLFNLKLMKTLFNFFNYNALWNFDWVKYIIIFNLNLSLFKLFNFKLLFTFLFDFTSATSKLQAVDGLHYFVMFINVWGTVIQPV